MSNSKMDTATKIAIIKIFYLLIVLVNRDKAINDAENN